MSGDDELTESLVKRKYWRFTRGDRRTLTRQFLSIYILVILPLEFGDEKMMTFSRIFNVLEEVLCLE